MVIIIKTQLIVLVYTCMYRSGSTIFRVARQTAIRKDVLVVPVLTGI